VHLQSLHPTFLYVVPSFSRPDALPNLRRCGWNAPNTWARHMQPVVVLFAALTMEIGLAGL
jgi:hypothetical protein